MALNLYRSYCTISRELLDWLASHTYDVNKHVSIAVQRIHEVVREA